MEEKIKKRNQLQRNLVSNPEKGQKMEQRGIASHSIMVIIPLMATMVSMNISKSGRRDSLYSYFSDCVDAEVTCARLFFDKGSEV